MLLGLSGASFQTRTMPKYAEFVFSAYGVFVVVIGVYAALLLRRTRAVRRALEILDRARKPSA